jgi:hypothetical protein
MSGFIGNVQSVAIADVQDNSVENSDIQDGAVTQAKIHSSVVLGGPSLGTGAIVRTNIDTCTEAITIPSGTNGLTIGPSLTFGTGGSITVNGAWTLL